MQHITLELNVLTEKHATLLTLLSELLPETRQSTGCISIEVFIDENNPNRIILIEQWEKAEDYMAYLNRRIESGVFDQLSELLNIEPKITYWQKSAI